MAIKEMELGDFNIETPSKKRIRRRKRVEVEDTKETETPKKRVRKRRARSAAPKDKSTKSKAARKKPPVDKTQSLALIDEFEQHQAELLDKLPDVMQDEIQHVNEYGHMFKTLSRMARIAEKKYLETNQSKDMYAALKAYAEMREIIADMKAMSDFSQFSEMIKDQIVKPLAHSSAAAIVEYHKEVMSYLQTTLEPSVVILVKEKLSNYAREAGVKIQESVNSGNKAADALFSAGNK